MLLKYWRRLFYRNDAERFPLWLYLMFISTLSNGIAFTFFGKSQSAHGSVLFRLTSAFGGHYVSLWGVLAIAAVVLSIANLLFRYRPISSLGPYLGYLVWFYAVMVYLVNGYVLQMIGAGIWLSFWILHHIRLWEYRRNVDNGKEIPPK